MKYLITGGAGFIGSNFCHYIYNENDSFVCLDALTYAGNTDFISDLLEKPNFRFVKGNICDEAMINDLFENEKFDYVINFAAESHVENSIFGPQPFIDSNITGVRVLLDASRKYNVTRFHQVSTDEVYGELGLNDEAFDENSPLRPTSPYSISKTAADLLVLSYYKMFNQNVTISRCSNNYGIYQHIEKFIPTVISQARANKDITLHGDGSNIRDWVNVFDHCQGIEKIVKLGRAGEVYNIGSHNEVSNKALANIILNKMPSSQSKLVFVKNRLVNDYRYALNYDKISNELGYEPKYNFENSLDNIMEWYLNK